MKGQPLQQISDALFKCHLPSVIALNRLLRLKKRAVYLTISLLHHLKALKIPGLASKRINISLRLILSLLDSRLLNRVELGIIKMKKKNQVRHNFYYLLFLAPDKILVKFKKHSKNRFVKQLYEYIYPFLARKGYDR